MNLRSWARASACSPASNADFAGQLTAIVLGGPLANLFLAMACLGLSILAEQDRFSYLCLMTAGVSFITFICVVFPIRSWKFMTDGERVLSLRKHNLEVEQEMLIKVLEASSVSGVRPRDLRVDLLERLSILRSGRLVDLTTKLLIYRAMLDNRTKIGSLAALSGGFPLAG